MSTTEPRGRPPLAVLVGLGALTVAPVIASWLGLSDVGAFRMFTRPFEQHVALTITTDDGAHRAVAFASLEPHLSRDDRRVLMPAVEWAPGETAASLLDARGARNLAELVCALHPEAAHATVEVTRRSLPSHAAMSGVRGELGCPQTDHGSDR